MSRGELDSRGLRYSNFKPMMIVGFVGISRISFPYCCCFCFDVSGDINVDDVIKCLVGQFLTWYIPNLVLVNRTSDYLWIMVWGHSSETWNVCRSVSTMYVVVT